MHDPLKIYKAAEILSDAIVFAGITALATSIIASLCCIIVTFHFTSYLKSVLAIQQANLSSLVNVKKLAIVLACLMPLGLSGCGGWGDSEDCYWWHRHRHPHHWRDEDGKSEIVAPVPVMAAMPTEQPPTPEIVEAKPGPFGAVTAMKELQDIRRLVTELANRPVVCLCDCGRRPFRDAAKSPGPVMFWRVDPLNPTVIQYGYEMGGFFIVLSSAPRPAGFEPPK
jgi:hypothetical protein